MTKWKRWRCPNCDGAGIVPDYGQLGMDFYGEKECRQCTGIGYYSQSPTGRLALYPGGPFIGRLSKADLEFLSQESLDRSNQ